MSLQASEYKRITVEEMKETIASVLKGIDRYNPENLNTFEMYVRIQVRDNAYDLEANLAVLKLYQLNTGYYNAEIVQLILLKALTNLPHTDFVLCKCLIVQANFQKLKEIVCLHNLLETCQFKQFWLVLAKDDIKNIIATVTGFHDSIRKFICHVVNITYQHIEKETLCVFLGISSNDDLMRWMDKYGWKETENGLIFIANQEENIKTKNITEKIDFESVAATMSLTR